MALKLDRTRLQSFQIAKVFDDNKNRINAIDFSDNGESLVTSSHDDSVNLYNVLDAQHSKVVYSKKYGCSHVLFTHAADTILHASTKQNHDLRYLSLHDTKYLCYYRGHKETVNSLALNPLNDTFLSASADKTVRMWDLRTPDCQGLLQTGTSSVAAWDPSGRVFAVGLGSKEIKMFASQDYTKGPFCSFSNLGTGHEWKNMTFSPDGQQILLSTAEGDVTIVDSFHGNVIARIQDKDQSASGDELEASWSPDGEHVVMGCQNGRLHVWDKSSQTIAADLEGHHDPVNCVKFNPKFAMMASACSRLCFWLPSP